MGGNNSKQRHGGILLCSSMNPENVVEHLDDETEYCDPPASHRTLLAEEFQDNAMDSLELQRISDDPENSVIFALLNNSRTCHSTIDIAGRNMLVSMEPDKRGKTFIFTVTDGMQDYFYNIRTVPHIIQDKEKFLETLKQCEGESKFVGMTHMEKWTRYMDAIVDSLGSRSFDVKLHPPSELGGQSHVNLIDTSAPWASLHLHLEVNANTRSIIDIPLKPLAQHVLKRRLPMIMFSMFDQHQALEQSNEELRKQMQAMQNELNELRKGTTSENGSLETNKRPVFQAFPKTGGSSSSGKKTLEFSSDDHSFEVPLTKVLEILEDWKSKLDESESAKVDYIIDVIQKDSLYDIDVDSLVDKASDDETKFWIQSELFSKPASKKFNRMLRAYAKIITFSNALMNIVQVENKQLDMGISPDIDKALSNLDSYDFDIFQVDKVTNGHPLVYVGLKLFEKYDLARKFSIPVKTLRAFFEKLEAGYLSNSYHNKIHAADVMQTLNVYLGGKGVMHHVSHLDIMAALVAAAMHDYGHPGVNNMFEIVTGSERALLYNDQSVLENFHLSQVFALLRQDEYNILVNMTDEERRYIREVMISMVLATDIGQHFALLKEMKSGILKNFTSTKKEDMHMLLKLLIKCADVSNPTKNGSLSRQWAENVMEEFYRQGDQERECGIPLSPFMDRTKPAMAKCQLGFIDYIAGPLFEILATFDDSFTFVVDNLKNNKVYWAAELSKETAAAAATTVGEE